MAFVEHNDSRKYPPFAWAKNLRATLDGAEMEVSGVEPLTEEDFRQTTDVIRAYRLAITRYGGTKRQGKNAPHVQFANADNDQKLLTFTNRYGPVLVKRMVVEERPVISTEPFAFDLTESVRIARQNLCELRQERLLYRSLLLLLFELRREKQADLSTIRQCVLEIVRTTSDWPRQWERERSLRINGLGYSTGPNWTFTEKNVENVEQWNWNISREPSGDPIKDAFMTSPIDSAHYAVCEILNAFSPIIYPWGRSPVEAPHWDLVAGIRPVLYYILRREYLGGGGIAVCRNSDCRNVFEIERSGQEFCSEDCSRLQRQREYWATRGKKLRALRSRSRSKNRTVK